MAAKNPPGVPTRDHLTGFYLTKDHAKMLRRFATEGGFRSVSHLLTSLMEPVIVGGFSLASMHRSLLRVQKHMIANGVQFSADWSSLIDLLSGASPPPPIADDEISPERVLEDLERLRKYFEAEARRANKKTKPELVN